MAREKAAAAPSLAKGPHNLSYGRSLIPTDAPFYSVTAGGVRVPVPVLQKAILGTQSQFHDDAPATGHPNPQRVEYAALPFDAEHLAIMFNLAVIDAVSAPHACDHAIWRQGLVKAVADYRSADGFQTLGRLYAANIANGRWAWKNRLMAGAFTVMVRIGSTEYEFNALAHSLDDLMVTASNPDVIRLGDVIAAGLRGEGMRRLTVEGDLHMAMPGCPVFPSQEFVTKPEKGAKDDVGKVLFGIPIPGCPRCAAFHEQKIGNAIRTIDIWHEGFTEKVEGMQVVDAGAPLPVNPYGQHKETFSPVRSTNNQTPSPDFYSLLKGIMTGRLDPAKPAVNPDIHFVMANLIRGGVFGVEKKADKKAAAEKEAA
jgi:CRISPR-associated protein Csy3